MEMKTELRQIADRIGLGEYPVELEAIYEAQKGSTAPACDLKLIDQLQEKYDLFGEYYALVKQSAEEINADPDMNAWVRAAAQFHKEVDKATAMKLPVPNVPEKATSFAFGTCVLRDSTIIGARKKTRRWTYDINYQTCAGQPVCRM